MSFRASAPDLCEVAAVRQPVRGRGGGRAITGSGAQAGGAQPTRGLGLHRCLCAGRGLVRSGARGPTASLRLRKRRGGAGAVRNLRVECGLAGHADGGFLAGTYPQWARDTNVDRVVEALHGDGHLGVVAVEAHVRDRARHALRRA